MSGAEAFVWPLARPKRPMINGQRQEKCALVNVGRRPADRFAILDLCPQPFGFGIVRGTPPFESPSRFRGTRELPRLDSGQCVFKPGHDASPLQQGS